ncbi:MAG: prepilin peptidase [Lachnospiraceae bacterium]|nr:prepilin peptidase [Lachnospiraceae bacterium]
MWTIDNIVCILFLSCCGVVDIKERCVPRWLLCMGTGCTVIARIIYGEMPFILWISGAMIGVIFIFVSRGTRESFGYGDSWLILLLGIYLGLWKVLYVLFIAFFSCGLVAMGGILKKKLLKNTTIPFIPFLAIGFWGVMIFEI